MTYQHDMQYRCPIIRGKALTDLDNLLPRYVLIIDEICPVSEEDFRAKFNLNLRKYFPAATTEKTISNHRTEIAGKLFGLYFKDNDDVIHLSDRAQKFLDDSDQPAFFKDVCAKLQFPNGLSKNAITLQQLEDGISIRQLSFVLETLKVARENVIEVTKKDIGYYVLNSRDVLQGKAIPSEIILQLKTDREAGVSRSVKFQRKPSTYCHQHINEQINLLILANLVLVVGDTLRLNPGESEAIEMISSKWDQAPAFDFHAYDLSDPQSRKKASLDWGLFYAKLADIDHEKIVTKAEALAPEITAKIKIASAIDKMQIGNEGEEYVYMVERKRVQDYSARLVNKVKKLGHIKGLGYDIQSIWASGEFPEYAKYIEVKTTKRVTPPGDLFEDTVNLTRNEWVAACQHKENYFLYRVYLYQGGIRLFIITNPYQKDADNGISVVPIVYRVDFGHDSGCYI